MDDSHWQRQLVIGLVLLLVVGALLGGIVAFAGIKAADLAGINNTTSKTTSEPHLYVPRNAHTPTTGPTSTAPTTGAAPSTSTLPPQKPQPSAVRLTISPTTASTYERINLTGTYDVPNGSPLQVQRKENGAWVNFPTVTQVSQGRFATYVETGHVGINRFRMTDTLRGRSSNVALVTVL